MIDEMVMCHQPDKSNQKERGLKHWTSLGPTLYFPRWMFKVTVLRRVWPEMQWLRGGPRDADGMGHKVREVYVLYFLKTELEGE